MKFPPSTERFDHFPHGIKFFADIVSFSPYFFGTQSIDVLHKNKLWLFPYELLIFSLFFLIIVFFEQINLWMS